MKGTLKHKSVKTEHMLSGGFIKTMILQVVDSQILGQRALLQISAKGNMYPEINGHLCAIISLISLSSPCTILFNAHSPTKCHFNARFSNTFACVFNRKHYFVPLMWPTRYMCKIPSKGATPKSKF